MDEYIKIKQFPNYEINKHGIIRVIFNKKILNGSRNPAGYINFRLSNEHGTKTIGRHRILMQTFKNNGEDLGDLVVNHINGFKGDDRLDNLEIVTYSQNARHAGLHSLTTKSKPLYLKNHITGEIFFFETFKDCADYLDISKDTVSYWVNVNKFMLYKDTWIFKLYHDQTPWPKIALASEGLIKKINVLYLKSGEEVTYNSISEFCSIENISAPTVSLWLKTNGQMVLPGLIMVKYDKSVYSWKKVIDPIKELEIYTRQRAVVLIVDEKKMIFESTTDAADFLGIGKTTLHYRLKHGNGKMYDNVVAYYYTNS